jgi:hypothetical protein
VGSIPDVTGFFNVPNPSSHTLALESTQPLTEMNTRNLLGGKGRLALWPSVSQLSRKCGSLNSSQPYGSPQPVTGIALPFTFIIAQPFYLKHTNSNVRFEVFFKVFVVK